MMRYFLGFIFVSVLFVSSSSALNWRDFITVNGKPLSESGDTTGPEEGRQEVQAAEKFRPAKHWCAANGRGESPDSRDPRWCMNMTLEGGEWYESQQQTFIIPTKVDLAYIRAKRFLQFEDADDREANKNSQYNNNTSLWDGIAGTYYKVKAVYGGPRRKDPILWRVKYTVEFETVSDKETKVILDYQVYGRDTDPNLFKELLMDSLTR